MMENQSEKGGRGARRPLCIKNKEAKKKKNIKRSRATSAIQNLPMM